MAENLEASRSPQRVGDFRGIVLPEPAIPAGYASLIQRFALTVPTPIKLAAIAARTKPRSDATWRLYAPSYKPDESIRGQLGFALRYEGVDLGVLAALFERIDAEEIVAIATSEPSGSYARRIWFLYEWLRDEILDIPNAPKVRAVPIVDVSLQYALSRGPFSVRHRIFNNLPGTRRFCPLVRRTAFIDAKIEMHLDDLAAAEIGATSPDVVTRAAAFLLLADSKSSFAIEKETPTAARAVRWGQAIGQAGRERLTISELERLQRIVIGDARFVELGLRTHGSFVGTHDRVTHEPIPEHISARAQDLEDLLTGVIEYNRGDAGLLDPVVAAAVIAFGFVYIHPFQDGNGRIHRYLFHDILARAKYAPPGFVFPISAAILRELQEYQRVLETYSSRLLPLIEWRETDGHNIEVQSDTANFYRFFDATAQTEFLYECIERTVLVDLPEEVRFLEACDQFSRAVGDIIDMPQSKIDLLRSFLRNGKGALSKRARDGEFALLTQPEIGAIEERYAQAFDAIVFARGSRAEPRG